MRNASGRTTIHYIDLGIFTIDTLFERRGNDLVVRASYSGNPRSGNVIEASDAYKQLDGRLPVHRERSVDGIGPRLLTRLEFAKLAELIASKGVVVTAVRSPTVAEA